jgi:hypothetical protein
MQTTIAHTDSDLVGYVGLGGQHALLIYPFWAFKERGAVGSKAFDLYQFDRGYAVHFGLIGLQWLTKRKKVKQGQKIEGATLPGFVEPTHTQAA